MSIPSCRKWCPTRWQEESGRGGSIMVMKHQLQVAVNRKLLSRNDSSAAQVWREIEQPSGWWGRRPGEVFSGRFGGRQIRCLTRSSDMFRMVLQADFDFDCSNIKCRSILLDWNKRGQLPLRPHGVWSFRSHLRMNRKANVLG